MILPKSSAVLMMMYLCGAVGLDIWKRKIPNEYILSGFIILIFVHGTQGIIEECIVMGVLVIPLYMYGVLGAGDIKLLCVLAGYYSAKMMTNVLVYAFVLTALATVGVKVSLFLNKADEKVQDFPFTIPILLSLISHIWG